MRDGERRKYPTLVGTGGEVVSNEKMLDFKAARGVGIN